MSTSCPLKTAYQALLSRGRLQPNKGQAALVNQLSSLQERLTNSQRQPWQSSDSTKHNNGIYIYGGVGTGKSRIADLFTATLPEKITRRRAHFFEFMTDTHMRLHESRSKANYQGDPLTQIGRQIQHESSVLSLDEFQVSDIADAMILKRLFTSFWNSGGILVATSNRHPTELYKDGLNRPLFIPFIEELQHRCLVFHMPGTHDYRMDKQQNHNTHQQETFLHDPAQYQESLTQALTKTNQALEPLTIKVVMNRSFTVQGTPRDKTTDKSAIVSSTFKQLCETPHGPADYHALCSAASTVYMHGLRKFAAHDLDIVRRFITLVDVAYEARARIICLSDAPLLDTFKNIIDPDSLLKTLERQQNLTNLTVRREGGSSSSMASTFIGEMEWSATGLKDASLATGGAGEKDVRFAIGRAISRLTEMGSSMYGMKD